MTTYFTFLNWILVITGIFLLFNCKSGSKDLKDFDEVQWQTDKMGCNGLRKNLFQTVRKQKNKLKGMGPQEIIKIFGKPDKEDLYRRGQTFFLYYMEPGSQCKGQNIEKEPLTLRIRFSALNNVTEVSFENY